jgi:hypothetical protein
VRAALFPLGNPEPRVETRGNGYYTLSGYLEEYLLVINIRYIVQNKCESCSPERPSLLGGKGWGWVKRNNNIIKPARVSRTGLGWFPVTMQVKWSVKRFADASLQIKLLPECR